MASTKKFGMDTIDSFAAKYRYTIDSIHTFLVFLCKVAIWKDR